MKEFTLIPASKCAISRRLQSVSSSYAIHVPLVLDGVLFSVIGVLMLSVSASPAAVINTFTDRATFNGAVGSNTVEDFNAFVSEEPFHTTPLDVGPFTLSMTGAPYTADGRNTIDVPPPLFPVFNVDGTTVANVLTLLGDSLFFSFDEPILAFGADFGDLNDDLLRTRIVVDGVFLTPPVTTGSQVRFFGFQTDTAFSTVEFRAATNDGYGIDNVAFSPIPEPTTFTFLGLGSLALVMVRRRG